MPTDRVRTVLVILFLISLFLGSLAGCGGGGDPGQKNSPVQLQASITATGSLAVTVGNLPTGISAALHVSGPGNYAADLTGSQTLGELAPGLYTITALPAVAGATTWTPSPPTQDVRVDTGTGATASVQYAQAPARLALRHVATLASPTYLTAPRGDARQFVTERAGRILVLEDGAPLSRPFLDLRAVTDTSGEGGLLSLAFDPDYAANGHFYVYRTNASHDILVERYTVSGDRNLADAASRLEIIRIAHPLYMNHFGGQLAFDPDGYLTIGTGDGGGAGDPNGNAQNLNALLGKLLRLDVRAASAAEPYRIPASNPWPNAAGHRPEVWASGLRNPWRFSYAGNRLYIADVGQEAFEEIDLVPSRLGALNFGWNRMEASTCYGGTPCDRTGLIYPVVAYAHTAAEGSPCSVIGGFVYRGSAIPALAGHYFYSDLCAGFLRSFYAVPSGALYAVRDWDIASVGRIVSFGEDGQGELYMLALDGGIWRIVQPSP